MYFHLSNSRGGWNKRGGGARVVKSILKHGEWDFLGKNSCTYITAIKEDESNYLPY